MSFIIYPLALVVTLAILITIHEFGHFWVARRVGVKVLRFSIGFGKPIWRKVDKYGTEFVVAAIPFGGYVRMLDEREGDVDPEERHRAFNTKPVGSRIAVVAAGPLFNFIFAVLAFFTMYTVGVPGTKPLLGQPTAESPAAMAGIEKGDLVISADGEPVKTMQSLTMVLLKAELDRAPLTLGVEDTLGQRRQRTLDFSDSEEPTPPNTPFSIAGLNPWPLPVVIGRVMPDSAAQTAGLQTNDHIIAIDQTPVDSWQQMATIIGDHPEQPLNLTIIRNNRQQTITITPQSVETPEGPTGRIGIGAAIPEDYREKIAVTLRYGPFDALGKALVETWDMSTFILEMMWKIITLQASAKNLGGPITIAQSAGDAASIGWLPFVHLLAIISISLGVLNLLPVPLLDGGHLLYYGIELVKGSPLSEPVQAIGQRIGIVLLGCLIVLALYNDLVRLFTRLM